MNVQDNYLNQFCSAFDIPKFKRPWLDRFFEEAEIELVLLLTKKPMLPAQIVDRLKRNTSNHKPDDLRAFLERTHQRGIIDLREDGRYQPADFHARFEIWAIFEGWKDIPEEIRERLNAWEMKSWETKYRDHIENLKKGASPSDHPEKTEYLLLHETKELLDQIDHVYLWPCPCRAMMRKCKRPSYTCLRLTNDRGLGWEISRERAKEIVHEANRKGLMQVADFSREPDGWAVNMICNCCTDCCFPQRLSERLDAGRIWPTKRYVVRHLKDQCSSCSRCVRRCPFQAFSMTKVRAKQGKPRRQPIRIHFNSGLCRGCGVCSTGCPEEAIMLVPLEECKETHLTS